ADAAAAPSTPSLHDALPICRRPSIPARRQGAPVFTTRRRLLAAPLLLLPGAALAACSGDVGSSAAEAAADGDGADRAGEMPTVRSEEHTSELQSRFDLVCRL